MARLRKKKPSFLARRWPFRREPPKPKRGRAILLVLLALVALRVSLPYAVEEFVDAKLDESPEYDGNVGDVDINWLLDGYRVENVEIVREGTDSPVTLLRVAELDLGIDWGAILRGALVASARVVRPEAVVHLAAAPDEAKKAAHIDYPALLQRLFPFRIDRLEVVDGVVRLAEAREGPNIDLDVRDIDVVATNLTNSLKISDSLFAHVAMTARPLGESEVKVNVAANPNAETPTFNVDLQVRGLPLPRLNPWIKYLADVDVEKGTLDVYAEVAAKGGRFDGYLKPMFHDLRVFSLKKDLKDKGSPLQKAWEAIVGGASEIVENQKKEQIAARIPVEGRLDAPEVEVWPAVTSALRNAFIRALKSGLEGSIDFRDVPPARMHKKADKAKAPEKRAPEKKKAKKKGD